MDCRKLTHAIQIVRKNYRGAQNGNYIDISLVDDLFILSAVSRVLMESGGAVTHDTINDNDSMLLVYEYMEEEYDKLVSYIEEGSFWQYYVVQHNMVHTIPFFLDLFIMAIHDAGLVNGEIKITNYKKKDHIPIILTIYKSLLSSM